LDRSNGKIFNDFQKKKKKKTPNGRPLEKKKKKRQGGSKIWAGKIKKHFKDPAKNQKKKIFKKKKW